MAGISKKTYKTKNGIVIKYTITYRDIFGKQRTTGLYDTEREAAKHLDDFNNRKKTHNNVTFGDIVNTFMKKVNLRCSKSTKEGYQLIIDVYLKKFMNIKYSRIQPIVFQDFLYEIEIEKPYMAHNILGFCKAAANYCKKPKIRLISENIFDDIDGIKLPESKKQNLTLNDVYVLMKECTISYNSFFPILFCLILNGMRQGELFALHKEDFNFTHNTIRINKQYTQREFKEKTKNDKSNRFVSMFAIFVLFMDIYLPTVSGDTDLVFPNSEGGFIDAHNIRKRYWYKLLTKCGYDYNYTSLHKLRAFYIDLCFYLGVPSKFTQGQVGHAKYETTFNSYASSNSSIREAALAKANEGMGFYGFSDTIDQDGIKEAFKDILISYVKHNPKIVNIEKELIKIDEFFGATKKCENNVRIIDKSSSCKIIKFPKKQSGS